MPEQAPLHSRLITEKRELESRARLEGKFRSSERNTHGPKTKRPAQLAVVASAQARTQWSGQVRVCARRRLRGGAAWTA